MSIIASLLATPTNFANRVVCGEDKDEAIQIAMNARPQPWFFDVICHGAERGVPSPLINGQHVEITVEQLATFIDSQPGYHHQPVRLLMCWVGKDPNGFAQQLANRLGVPVLAAPDLVRADWLECLRAEERFHVFCPNEIAGR